MALVAGIAACGDDMASPPLAPAPPPPPPRPPLPVEQIPDQAMVTGQTVSLDLSSHFHDPDGDALTYAASWPAAGVVPISATLSGSTLMIVGVAGGATTVTVTASDQGGLTATERFSVMVTWANRAPEPLFGAASLGTVVGGEARQNVSNLFHDPDGDILTYTAESSAPAVAAVSVSDSILTILGVAEGAAIVTVTATDPGGLTGMLEVYVIVQSVERGSFRDDFTSSASLSDWEVVNAEAAVADDLLRVTNTEAGVGVMRHEFGHSFVRWMLRVRMGRARADGAASVWWATGDDRYTFWRLDIGTHGGTNHQLYLADAEEQTWLKFDDVSGTSDAIDDGPNEMTEITLAVEGADFVARAGDAELFRVQPSGSLLSLLNRATGVFLGSVGDVGATALFDWVEISGIVSRAETGAPPDLSGDILSLRLPGSVSMAADKATPGVNPRR